MVVHGDELGRTQQGNNKLRPGLGLSWIDWEHLDGPLIEFVSALVHLRREHPTFRLARFFDGHPVKRAEGEPIPDIVWFTPDGNAMQPDDWDSGFGKALTVFLNGDGIRGETCAVNGSPTPTSWCGSTLTTTRCASRCPRTNTRRRGKCWLTPPAVVPRRSLSTPMRRSRFRLDHWSSFGHSLCSQQSQITPWLLRSQRSPQLRPALLRHHRSGHERRPDLHLPGADHLGLRSARGDVDRRLPARPRHRLDLPVAPAHRRVWLTARIRRRRPRRRRPGPGGSAGLQALAEWPTRPDWGCSSTSCRTTWGSPPTCQQVVVGCADQRARARYADAFDIDWEFGGGKIRVPSWVTRPIRCSR